MALTLNLILACFYFMLPAYIANMTPVFVKGYKFLENPINKKLFGKNKTWRGLVFAVLAAGFVALFQFYFYPVIPNFGLIDYNNAKLVFAAALLLGIGAILGDMVESFFKRRLNIAPGKPWMPFDQLDFVIGALALVCIVYLPTLEIVLIILIMSPILHLLVNFIGYKLKIRESRF